MPRLVTSDVLAEREAALAAAGEASPMSPLSFAPTAANCFAVLLVKSSVCDQVISRHQAGSQHCQHDVHVLACIFGLLLRDRLLQDSMQHPERLWLII